MQPSFSRYVVPNHSVSALKHNCDPEDNSIKNVNILEEFQAIFSWSDPSEQHYSKNLTWENINIILFFCFIWLGSVLIAACLYGLLHL